MDIIELRSGRARLRVAPHLGARVTALKLIDPADGRDREILHPFPEETALGDLLRWPKGGLYPLVPYSNRIRDARLRFDGEVHKLPPHPDAAPHTLHGHAHRLCWTVADRTDMSVRLTLRHRAGGEWPWSFSTEMTLLLTPAAVEIGLGLRNDDARPMPAGLGLHPYLAHSPTDAVSFDAAFDWRVGPDGLPGRREAAAGHDRRKQPLPPGGITLHRSGGTGWFELRSADGGALMVSASSSLDHLVIHRPEESPYLCVEPTSHVADGFNLAEDGVEGTGRMVLAPGQEMHAKIMVACGPAIGQLHGGTAGESMPANPLRSPVS
jgi:aldose 1-epimerase